MSSVFLSAQWLKLAMANYAIDPSALKAHLPARTELDEWNGTCYISLVGFMFVDTKVKGIPVPFHRDFEEVNLRFYVRYKDGNIWKRGVVFIKELVPKPLLTFIANTLYKEHYETRPMEHSIGQQEGNLHVEYRWQVGEEWNHIRVVADQTSSPMPEGSEAEFITEHYWGYTKLPDGNTSEYEVRHPRWNIHTVHSYDIHCSAGELYGAEFVEAMSVKPISVFLAEGSEISVMDGGILS